MRTLRLVCVTAVLCAVLVGTSLFAADWPEWRGAGRVGVWTEDGIVERFPADGLKVVWRAPVKGGFAGPVVADGRVFVTDFEFLLRTRVMDGTERVLALDERTGEVLWTHEWPAAYRNLQFSYATGPRATPTVDGDRVYVAGGAGMLLCLEVEDRRRGLAARHRGRVRHDRPGLGDVELAAGRRRSSHRRRGR